MSVHGPGLPRSGWLAVGVASGAAAVAVGLPAFVPLVAGLLAVAVGRSGLAPLKGRRGITATTLGVGALLLGIRVIAGPAPAPAPVLPTEPGPWRATIESMSSARDGSQVARLRLETAAGEVEVAATLPAFPVVLAGAIVEVDGTLRPPPDDDPYGEYLRRTGASGSLRASGVRVVAPADGGSLQGLRDAAGDALRLALPEPEAGLAEESWSVSGSASIATWPLTSQRPVRATSSPSPAGTSRSWRAWSGRSSGGGPGDSLRSWWAGRSSRTSSRPEPPRPSSGRR